MQVCFFLRIIYQFTGLFFLHILYQYTILEYLVSYDYVGVTLRHLLVLCDLQLTLRLATVERVGVEGIVKSVRSRSSVILSPPWTP